MLVEPFPVRFFGFEVVVDVVVFEHLTVLHIQSDHFTRLEATPLDDLIFVDVEYTVLARDEQAAVTGDDVFGRTQTVTIQHNTDMSAVGHTHGSRAVPGFKRRTDVFVEGTEFGIHVRGILPRCRDDRAGDPEKIHPIDPEKLDEVIETGTVTHPLLHDRQQACQLFVAKDIAFDRFAFGEGIEAVGSDRVDLPIMGDHPEGLGKLPFREGVGGETLVKQGETDLKFWVGHVDIKLFEMGGHHQPLVRDHLGRERRDIKVFFASEGFFDLFA